MPICLIDTFIGLSVWDLVVYLMDRKGGAEGGGFEIYKADESRDLRSMVLELPPAPAALVLVGLALATLSARSAAAFRLIAVFGPPGGDKLRPLLTPPAGEGEPGEDGGGEDCGARISRDSRES